MRKRNIPLAAVLIAALSASILLAAVLRISSTPQAGSAEPSAPAPSVTERTVPPAENTSGESAVVPLNIGEAIEIKEKMFVAQTNEIYINADDYLGKVIKYEGIFQSDTWEEDGVTHYSVIRYGPGCCGTDANCGFEVIWGSGQTDYPNQDDWVEAAGVLEEYDEDGSKYLRLSLTSMTVLDTRGEEYVEQ